MRTAGLVAIVLILMFVLRPNVFLGLFGGGEEADKQETLNKLEELEKQNAATKAALDEAERTLNAYSLKHKAGSANADNGGGGKVAYAPGFGPDDFKGEAYNAPDEPKQKMPPSLGGLWDILLTLKCKSKYDPKIDGVISDPQFTSEIKALDGKEITINGYIVPLQADGNVFMVSAYPVSTCFFCGAAGPESVLEVYPGKPIPYSEKVITLKGILRLNYNDPIKMPYIVEKAQLVY